MGLILAAGIVTLLALIAAFLLLRRAPPQSRGALITAFLVVLPLQPIAFYFLRLPIDVFIRAGLGTGLAWTIVSLFYAPLTEEPAKWLALAAPPVQRALSPANAVPLALAIGLGFGIGEIWFLAHAIASSAAYRDAPFWMFNGFILERLEVCLLHGVFVTPLLACLALRKPFWQGAMIGIAMHFITNAPLALAQSDFASLGAALWSAVLTLWVLALALAGGIGVTLLHQRLRKRP